MAQSVKHPTLAQIIISGFVGSNPTLGSVLTVQNLDVSDSVSPSFLPLFYWCLLSFKINKLRDTLVAQSVKCLTLGFSSGHDLSVHGFKPRIGLSADSAEPAWDSVSLFLCPSPIHKHTCTCTHALSQNK